MKWESVTSGIGQSAFALWNNGKKLVTLAFNTKSNAARIEFDQERRVFLIRKEGLLRNRTVLTNEYGIRLGKTGSEGPAEFIEFGQERYYYQSNANGSVTIFQDSVEQPLAIFEMGQDAEKLDRNSEKSGKTFYSLLMTMCWYLFQPGDRRETGVAPGMQLAN